VLDALLENEFEGASGTISFSREDGNAEFPWFQLTNLQGDGRGGLSKRTCCPGGGGTVRVSKIAFAEVGGGWDPGELELLRFRAGNVAEGVPPATPTVPQESVVQIREYACVRGMRFDDDERRCIACKAPDLCLHSYLVGCSENERLDEAMQCLGSEAQQMYKRLALQVTRPGKGCPWQARENFWLDEQSIDLMRHDARQLAVNWSRDPETLLVMSTPWLASGSRAFGPPWERAAHWEDSSLMGLLCSEFRVTLAFDSDL
ncbi:hypothetical protein CYMTET_34442, partial [Cymbomonas tetramitiformis]